MADIYRSYEEDSVRPAWGAPFFEEHLARYCFALKYVENKKVLELGCGKGYGARILATRAQSVLACDLNEKSIQFAQQNYSAANLQFAKVDVTSEFAKSDFDVVVSLEVLEHLYPDQVQQYLTTIKQALNQEGRLILSTPNHDVVLKSGSPVPEFHIFNLGSRELRRLLSEHFGKVEIFGQAFPMGLAKKIIYILDRWSLRHSRWMKGFRRPQGTPLSEEKELVPWQLEQGFGRAQEYFFSRAIGAQAGMILAVCSKPRL